MLINQIGETINLAGTWQFSFDQTAGWGSISVPGCWETQGFSKYVDGPARCRRTIMIPAGWAGQTILLECGAVSYACRVFCNDIEVGSHFGVWAPFTIDLSPAARPGEENRLELEIYKPGERYPTRSSLAGFLPDVATTFGGIWQPICLRAVSCAFSDFQLHTEYDTSSIHVRAQAEAFGKPLVRPAWKLAVFQNGRLLKEADFSYTPGKPLAVTLPLAGVLPWTPASPTLYDVELTLFSEDQPIARAARRTGFRKISAAGDQLLLNGQPFMVRGILSWGWEPDRIAPIYSPEQAREEMRKAREMGFNLIKLCLVIPSPAYFDIADEEGMLLWEELPMWLPEVTAALRDQAPREYAEIAQMLAHHPSVALYSLGCELSQAVDGSLLEQLNGAVRGAVRDVLVCDNSGSGESYGGLDFDFADFTDYHPYYDLHFFEPLLDNWRRDWKAPRPWIFGEFCDSDTFRDLTEIIQASGGKRPWWLTRDNPVTAWRPEAQAMLEWEQRLEEANPGFSFQQLVEVSYQQSYVIRKYTLETLRKRRGMGGYIITGLRDTPISTSGIWDDFGRPKWSAEAFTQINGEAILALDVVRRRQWHHGGDRPDKLDAHNFWAGETTRWYVILHDTGPGFPTGSQLAWTLTGPNDTQLAYGSTCLEQDHLEQMRISGDPRQVGVIQVQLPEVPAPAQLHLEVRLSNDSRSVSNIWPVWVYPRPRPLSDGLAIFDPTGSLGDFSKALNSIPRIPPGQALEHHRLVIATSLTPQLWQAVEAGTRVLLLQQGDSPLPACRCPFWREAIKLFPKHPLWSLFPQQGFSDMQFFGLASDVAFDTAHLAGALPSNAVIRPIMRRLDARQFTMAEHLFEARVNTGLLIGCALRLQGGMGAQSSGWERNVAGGAMLSALLQYLENPIPNGSVE